MAEFLTTYGINHALQKLIEAGKDIYLVSPYIKAAEQLQAYIKDANRVGAHFTIICRGEDLQTSEIEWINQLDECRLFSVYRLHAKCYLNEETAIVTSMNLYEFSQQNNDEMGFQIRKAEEEHLYSNIRREVERLIRKGKEVNYRKAPNSLGRTIIPPEAGNQEVPAKYKVAHRNNSGIPTQGQNDNFQKSPSNFPHSQPVQPSLTVQDMWFERFHEGSIEECFRITWAPPNTASKVDHYCLEWRDISSWVWYVPNPINGNRTSFVAHNINKEKIVCRIRACLDGTLGEWSREFTEP